MPAYTLATTTKPPSHPMAQPEVGTCPFCRARVKVVINGAQYGVPGHKVLDTHYAHPPGAERNCLGGGKEPLPVQ